jgi:hypothetical protein
LRKCGGSPCAERALPAAAFPHDKPLLAVDPVELLVVHAHALPLQKKFQASVAEPPSLGSQFLEPRSQRGVVGTPRLVSVSLR